MVKESIRRVPRNAAATPSEVTATIEALSPADFQRLIRSAGFHILRVGPRAADDKTAEELLNAAVCDLLNDTRRWDKTKVGFIRFLTQAMRSISSNWAKTYDEETTSVLESQLKRINDGGTTVTIYDRFPDSRPNPEEHLLHSEFVEQQRLWHAGILRQIDESFRDDEEAQKVLMAWREGYDPPTVRDLWGFSQNQYNTIVRRIRRNLERSGITAAYKKGGANVNQVQ